MYYKCLCMVRTGSPTTSATRQSEWRVSAVSRTGALPADRAGGGSRHPLRREEERRFDRDAVVFLDMRDEIPDARPRMVAGGDGVPLCSQANHRLGPEGENAPRGARQLDERADRCRAAVHASRGPSIIRR
jgi:hypothetical protein